MEQPKNHPQAPQHQLPPWETRPTTTTKKTDPPLKDQWRDIKFTLQSTFDRILPPHRRYLSHSRKTFIIFLLALLLSLLALILGLAIGLSTKKSNNHKSLPLGSQSYTGDLTYYGPALGACGVTSSDNDDIVSISHFTFDGVSKGSNPNANVLCGHKIRAVREGRSVDLRVVDRCVGCKATDIDVSPGAFKKLADPDQGRVQVTWAWLPPIPTIPP